MGRTEAVEERLREGLLFHSASKGELSRGAGIGKVGTEVTRSGGPVRFTRDFMSYLTAE